MAATLANALSTRETNDHPQTIAICAHRLRFTITWGGRNRHTATGKQACTLLGQAHVVTLQAGDTTEAVSAQTYAFARVFHTTPR
jgi:hypothetical protein